MTTKIKDLPLNEEGVSQRNSGYVYEGKEIFLEKRGRGRPVQARNPKYYSQERKVDACTLYAVYGDLEEVSKLTSIPVQQLRLWKQEPWWIEIIKQVYVEQNENLSSRISSTLDKALIQLNDRLEHGDVYITKTGQEVRRPIDAKVLTNMFDSLVHRRQVVRGEPTSISANIGIEDRLDNLAKAFTRFAAAKEVEHVPLEVEDAKES